MVPVHELLLMVPIVVAVYTIKVVVPGGTAKTRLPDSSSAMLAKLPLMAAVLAE